MSERTALPPPTPSPTPDPQSGQPVKLSILPQMNKEEHLGPLPSSDCDSPANTFQAWPRDEDIIQRRMLALEQHVETLKTPPYPKWKASSLMQAQSQLQQLYNEWGSMCLENGWGPRCRPGGTTTSDIFLAMERSGVKQPQNWFGKVLMNRFSGNPFHGQETTPGQKQAFPTGRSHTVYGVVVIQYGEKRTNSRASLP